MHLLAAFAVLFLAAAPQENEAEKLYRAMEKEVRSARTVHLVYEGEVTGEGKKMTFKGEAHLAENNLAHLELQCDFPRQAEVLVMISDGKSTRYKGKGKEFTVKNGTQHDLSILPAFITRVGLMTAFFLMGDNERKTTLAEFDKFTAPKEFKLAGMEKIAGHDTQAVDHEVKLGPSMNAKVRIWIDTKDRLPVKRELAVHQDGKEIFRVTETFTTFTVNGKADPKLFELPK